MNNVEKEIASLADATFAIGVGKRYLDYLKNVTLHRPQPAGTDPNVILHLEGQRWLVGMIMSQIEAHKKEQSRE